MDPDHGNCFTFNPLSADAYSKRAGQKMGLQMIFHSPSNDYLSFFLSSGYKIFLHQEDEEPIMGALGTMCSANQYYGFSVSKVKKNNIFFFKNTIISCMNEFLHLHYMLQSSF